MSDNNEIYFRLKPTIILLAERICKRKLYNVWWTYSYDSRDLYICLFCNDELSELTAPAWRQHGIDHLKEHNLLPFI